MDFLVAGGGKHVACPKGNVADIHFHGFKDSFNLEVTLGAKYETYVVPFVAPKMTARINMMFFQSLGSLTLSTSAHFLGGLMFVVTFVAKYVATRSDTKINSAVPTTRCSAIFFIITRCSTTNFTIKSKSRLLIGRRLQ